MQPNQVLSSMRRWGVTLGVGLLAVGLVLTGCDSDDSGMDEEFEDPSTILNLEQRVSNQDGLGILNTALGVTGQAETLGNEDATFTVFAPLDAAFDPYDVDALTNDTDLLSSVLDYHIVQGDALTADDLEDGQTLTTVQGDELTVSINNGDVFVEGAQVTTPDIEGTNGVAHVVDDVLLTNRTATERVQVTLATSILNDALSAAGRAGTLDSEDATFTVFAPSDAAFDPYDVDFLTSNTDLLGSVLDYHVVQGSAVTSDQLSDGDTFTTVQGDEITVNIDDDGNVFVEGAQVTTPDIEAGNAAIHLVDDVLITNRSPLERLQVNTATQTLRQQLENAGLASTFDSSVWTTFAPSNTAFENADLSGFSDSDIQEILQYHTLDGATDSEALLQQLSNSSNSEISVTTNQGEDLTITQVAPDSIVFNNGQAALNLNRIDQRTGNGSVIHQIDGVLIPPSLMQSVSYDLEAQMNDGAISEGVSGTVTFWEYTQSQTLVTLELGEGATGADVAHPAHIHDGESGDIAIYLTPIDGSGGGGTSARLVDRSFDELANFDGYVNIHESVNNLGTVVSQGDIGANATGTRAAGLDLVDNPRSEPYTLDANSNDGDVAPDGIPGTVEFIELTSSRTFVQVSLDPGTMDGATGASVSHPAHIHRSSDGNIEYFLSPVDGTDAESRSGKLVDKSYDTLTGFNGYVNVHESVANLGNVVSQGNIGANN